VVRADPLQGRALRGQVDHEVQDFAWSIRQSPSGLEIDEYPYVIFDEGTEEIRKAAMRGHKPWQPEGLVLDALREHVDVSTRAMRQKTLSGSTASGMKSEEPRRRAAPP
jgi:hypothetical protein